MENNTTYIFCSHGTLCIISIQNELKKCTHLNIRCEKAEYLHTFWVPNYFSAQAASPRDSIPESQKHKILLLKWIF